MCTSRNSGLYCLPYMKFANRVSPVEIWDGPDANDKSIKIKLFLFIARLGWTKSFTAYCVAEIHVNEFQRDFNRYAW